MKVIQILPELNSGGVERGTLEVASHLVRHGHEAVVISHGGRLVSELEAIGARHITLPVHRKSLFSLGQVGVMRRLLEKETPDIIHIRSRVPGWITWLAWRGMDPQTRPRLVSTVHGFYSVNAYSAVMTKGEKIIAVSESVKHYITKHYGIAPDRITVIHRGVSSDQYFPAFRPSDDWLQAWRRDYPQFDGKFLITLPGRITRWKGHEHFCQIIDALKTAGLPVHGIIAGSGHPKKMEFVEVLKKQISHKNLAGDITLIGDRRDMREVMSASAAILSLSLDPEAFGRVSLEAMCLGIPVAGYDHGGVAEQLAAMYPQGRIAPGDWQAMAELLKSWYDETPAAPLENRFTLEQMLEQTEQVYRSLLR